MTLNLAKIPRWQTHGSVEILSQEIRWKVKEMAPRVKCLPSKREDYRVQVPPKHTNSGQNCESAVVRS